MYKDLFCEKCILQFDKKYVFDLHLSLVHREEIKVKSEPQICEEKSQKHDKICSDHVVDKSIRCDTCDSLFKSKKNLEKAH